MLGTMRRNVTVLVMALGALAMHAFVPSTVAAQVAAPDSQATVQDDSVPVNTPIAAGGDASQDQVAAEADTPGTPIVVPAERRGKWTSILPPVVAIIIALALRRVIPALFVGILLGAWLVRGLDLGGLWTGLLDTYHVWVLDAVIDPDHAAILLFTLMIGGMVGIVSKSGGMQGVVNKITKWATTAQRGQVATSILGLAVFFDDYANTLVVGNTMRPVTDRLRISREKLAYIVDSTAAPVACLAFITTWIGYEVGLIGAALDGLPGYEGSAYSMFLGSIGYSFYPILALFMVFTIAISGRDFGAMYTAERRARTTGAVLGPDAKVDEAATESDQTAPNPDKPQRAVNAVLPVMVLVFGVIFFLFKTGEGDSLREIIDTADSYASLVYASLLGMLTAAILAVGQRILSVEEMVEAWYTGLKSMLFAMIILILAWSLSEITKALGTADFLVSVLGGSLSPWMLPGIVFVLAAATAFATGSSWGTMGILMPLVLPLGWAMLQLTGNPADHMHLISSSIACVLAGAVWGDHCSPISDTTILSSMASGCDHIDHVRTQLPYAGSVGILALFLGTVPVALGMPWWLGLILGAIGVLALVKFAGKPVDEPGSNQVSA